MENISLSKDFYKIRLSGKKRESQQLSDSDIPAGPAFLPTSKSLIFVTASSTVNLSEITKTSSH